MEQPEVIQDSEVENTAPESAEAAAPEHEIETEVTDTEEGTPADEEEVEYEGEKYKLPAKLKDALLRQADYTRKTQEVAEQRKQIEATAAEIQKRAEESQKYVQEYAEAIAVNKQVEQLQQYHRQLIDSENYTEAIKVDARLRELATYGVQLNHSITQKQQQQALAEQQTLAKQVQEASLYLQREIPNWSDERSNQLLKYGTSEGIPAEELSRIAIKYPALGKVLHKAEMYDRLEKKQVTKQPVTQEKPVTRVTASKSKSAIEPDKMSTDDWLKWRNAQIKRR